MILTKLRRSLTVEDMTGAHALWSGGEFVEHTDRMIQPFFPMERVKGIEPSS